MRLRAIAVDGARCAIGDARVPVRVIVRLKKRATPALRVCEAVERLGYVGAYFVVFKSASECALSLLTRGRESERTIL